MSVSSIQGNYLSGLKTGGLNTNRSTTNSIFPQTTQLPVDSVEINGKKKGLSNAQKCGIGLAIAGTLTAAALLLKGRVGAAGKEIKALAEHIEFAPAKTAEEAIAFAKTNLGIRKYSKDMPLDVMNWVNEGLVNVNNATKGKAIMPKNVAYKELEIGANNGVANVVGADLMSDVSTLAAMNSNSRTLIINKDFISQFDEFVKQTVDEIVGRSDIVSKEFGDDIVQAAKQLLEHPETSSFLDKMKLQGKYNEIASTIITKRQPVGGYKIDGFGDIYHEMGHLQHLNSRSGSLARRKDCKLTQDIVDEITTEQYKDAGRKQIANSVSWYAGTSPLEFVAETYENLVSQALHGGKKLPDDVMKLYAEYRGPVV